MFRIRRVYDDHIPINQEAIRQVQDILRSQFSGVSEEEIRSLSERLRNPLKYRFRSLLFVADRGVGPIRGFGLLLHAPDLRFCYLDYVAAATQLTGGGIGGALYERIREEARLLGSVGLFFECLPDSPEECRDPDFLKQNVARLRFYERYGARPIINTQYEAPIKPGDECMPHLVYDALGSERPLRRSVVRPIVRAILERKYGDLCPGEYIDKVVNSFQDDPVSLRGPRYVKPERAPVPTGTPRSIDRSIALVVTDRHEVHHVHDRGYVQAPVRIKSILEKLEPTGMFRRVEPRRFPESHIKAVHDPELVGYLQKCCANVPAGKSVYPYVFPIRNHARPPKELTVRAGYYCIDTFTPLNRQAYIAATRSVDCALTAARCLLEGYRIAYALIRPPGHHAERKAFGGFCYLNSSAIAAHFLSRIGTVAVLDVDYHHGNGTQDIFYERPDVLSISIHGHPRFAYPYFSGFEEEKGQGSGQGFNVNFPLPEQVDGARYRETLEKALRRILRFRPRFLVVALGLDPAKGDPTGTWSLQAKDFESVGRMIGSLYLPTLVVQEGGYKTRSLGVNARHFFVGVIGGAQGERKRGMDSSKLSRASSDSTVPAQKREGPNHGC
jgi:acetoin utilization deacetylase AcuC-like enzyme/GNAT superfamily N-acetyltransferase